MKFYGVIGYDAGTRETAPGVWMPSITERPYYGDVVKNYRSLKTGDSVNDDINVSNEISIIADPFAYQNFHSMRYVIFMGSKWKVSNVEAQYPRLILTLGGLFNEQDE